MLFKTEREVHDYNNELLENQSKFHLHKFSSIASSPPRMLSVKREFRLFYDIFI